MTDYITRKYINEAKGKDNKANLTVEIIGITMKLAVAALLIVGLCNY